MTGFEPLAETVERARNFLESYGRTSLTRDLSILAWALREGDAAAVERALSEATGGAGSLRDQYLYDKNGVKMTSDENVLANVRLDELVKAIELEARIAAAKYGIALIR